MPCRTAANDVIDDCAGVPGVDESIRDGLAQFDQVGKYSEVQVASWLAIIYLIHSVKTIEKNYKLQLIAMEVLDCMLYPSLY